MESTGEKDKKSELVQKLAASKDDKVDHIHVILVSLEIELLGPRVFSEIVGGMGGGSVHYQVRFEGYKKIAKYPLPKTIIAPTN